MEVTLYDLWGHIFAKLPALITLYIIHRKSLINIFQTKTIKEKDYSKHKHDIM